MTRRASLLLAYLLAFPQRPNLSQWIGKEMQILAALGAVPKNEQLLLSLEPQSLQTTQASSKECASPCTASADQFPQDSLVFPVGPDSSDLNHALHATQKMHATCQKDTSFSHNDIQQLAEVPASGIDGRRAVVIGENDGILAYPLPDKALPDRPAFDFLLKPKAKRSTELIDASIDDIYDRILARLFQSELRELNPHFQTDIRIAWLTVRVAQKDEAVECSPHVLATYKILSCHPNEVWPRIIANNQAKLGREYSDWFDQSGLLKPDVPKMPSLAAGSPNVKESAATGAVPSLPSDHATAPDSSKEAV